MGPAQVPRRSGSVVSGVPSAVQEVVRARVNRLPESVQMMLSAAAVVGSAIPLELLRRLTEAGASTDLVLNAVDVATAGGLLIERAAGQFAFAHDLVREHLYANLGPARRLKLHLSVARALESLAGEDAEVEALAYHYAMAAPLGVGALAADYAIRAWRHCLQQAALQQGISQLVRAERALDTDPSVSASTRPSSCSPWPAPVTQLVTTPVTVNGAWTPPLKRELPALRISWPPRPFRRQPPDSPASQTSASSSCATRLSASWTRSPCPSRRSSSHLSPITAAPTRDVIPPTTR